MFDLSYDVETVQDDKSGYHVATCPLCPIVLKRATAHGLMEAICEHMNVAHGEGRIGHA